MPRVARFQVSLALLLLGVSSSCERRQVSVPVPPAPAPAPPQPAPQVRAPAAAASSAPSSKGASTQTQESNRYQVDRPPQAEKKAARSPAPSTPAPSAPAPAPTVPAGPVAPTPAPKLGDVLTADQEKQYNASIDESLAHAQASLNSIGRRQLNRDQQADADQIKSFMQQALAARASDLAGAKSLAERAEVLARDFAASFH